MDDFDGLITVELHHGGKFMGENAYFMGSTIVESEYDFESLAFEELEIVMKANGYHSVLKYAARKVGDIEEYAFFHDKKSFEECINNHVDWGRKSLKLYFECLSDDLIENLNGDGHGDTNKDEDGGWNFDKDGDVPLVDESGSSEDGMEDGDFVSDDEEVVEARKIKEKDKVDKKAYQISNLMKEVGPCSTNLEVEATHLHSEYDDSDASMNSDNGLNKVRKMTKGKLYSSNCDHNTLIFEIGMRFRDCKECKEAVAEWAILNGHDITWKKSGGGKLEAAKHLKYSDGSCQGCVYFAG